MPKAKAGAAEVPLSAWSLFPANQVKVAHRRVDFGSGPKRRRAAFRPAERAGTPVDHRVPRITVIQRQAAVDAACGDLLPDCLAGVENPRPAACLPRPPCSFVRVLRVCVAVDEGKAPDVHVLRLFEAGCLPQDRGGGHAAQIRHQRVPGKEEGAESA